MENSILISITVEDLQSRAYTFIGRRLTDTELKMAKSYILGNYVHTMKKLICDAIILDAERMREYKKNCLDLKGETT